MEKEIAGGGICVSRGKELGSCRAYSEDRTKLPECRLKWLDGSLGPVGIYSWKTKRQKVEWCLSGTWGREKGVV